MKWSRQYKDPKVAMEWMKRVSFDEVPSADPIMWGTTILPRLGDFTAVIRKEDVLLFRDARGLAVGWVNRSDVVDPIFWRQKLDWAWLFEMEQMIKDWPAHSVYKQV